MAKKYILSYASGATGFGWEEEYDRLEEFEAFVNEMRHEYTARVTVWDNTLNAFVFWKDCLESKPETDMLHDIFRDMRTKTRKTIRK